MEMKTIIITGGTGLVGGYLSRMLAEQGYQVIILTRTPAKAKATHPNIRFAKWDVETGYIDPSAWAQADAVVHLAGAGVVAKPWTTAYKKEIIDSRVRSGALIVEAAKTLENKITTVVSASAIGYYGADNGNGPFVETDPADDHFLGETCRQWEQAIQPVQALGKRLVICRIGIVLANEGGALAEFKKPLKFRVGGILGNGQQTVSWIHIEDLCRIFNAALSDTEMQGVYNAVAPSPVSNKELTIALAKAMYGNGFVTLPVPSFVLKLMLGKRSIEVLKSTTVSAQKLVEHGFQFEYPTIEKAMQQLAGFTQRR
jgi:uncharacterized protein (TIGR01777 family)